MASGADAALCPDAVFVLQQSLTFAANNQKIYTVGYPTDSHRAQIVVGNAAITAAIRTESAQGLANVQIRNLIFNGNRKNLGAVPCLGTNDCAALLTLVGLINLVVDHVQLYDTRSWSHLAVTSATALCSGAQITNNQIGPGGDRATYADGISLACPLSTVKNNLITDVTDGGIVLFGAYQTVVSDNVIHADTVDMNLGVGLTDYIGVNGNLTGVVIQNNTIWASQGFMYVGVAAGNRLWFGNSYGANFNSGASVISNRIGGNIGMAIPVSGTNLFSIQNNQITAPNTVIDATEASNTSVQSGFTIVPAGSLDGLIYKELPITKMYRLILNRDPDGEGLLYYIEMLAGSQCTTANIQTVALDILNSAEGAASLAKMSNSQIVSMLYHVILNREADTPGLNYWLAQAAQGQTPTQFATAVTKSLYASAEFTRSALPNICN